MAKRTYEDDVGYVEPGDWSNIKKWLLTRMKDNIIEKNFSFDGPPPDKWPSFDDVVYTTFLKYLKASWIGKHMIQIEALESHYKSFYCSLMRVPMRKAVLAFINANKIHPSMFGDLFINNIFPAYMRNNVFIGNYLTHTNNIVVQPTLDIIFVIRNNDNHKSGKNRRRVFYHHKGWGENEYKPSLLKIGDDDDDDDDVEIVSIVCDSNGDLYVLDTNGRLFYTQITQKRIAAEEVGFLTTTKYQTLNNYRFDSVEVEKYWDIKTSTFLPLNQLKIVGIYGNNRKRDYDDDFGDDNIFFLTDTGDIYRNSEIENHNQNAFAKVPLPKEAKKIVLFSASDPEYLVAIDSNNALFVAMKREQDSSFSYKHTFIHPVILITFQEVRNRPTILFVTNDGASNNTNQIIGINFDFNFTSGKMVTNVLNLRPLIWDSEIPKSEDYRIKSFFSPHILSFSVHCMLVMDNESGKPSLLCVTTQDFSYKQEEYLSQWGLLPIKLIPQKISLGSIEKEESGDSDFILSVYNSQKSSTIRDDIVVHILLANQNLIRITIGDGITKIISPPKEAGNWKFECSYCNKGTNMVDPLRLLAFCSEKCSRSITL